MIRGIQLVRFTDGKKMLRTALPITSHATSADISKAPNVAYVIYDCGHDGSSPCSIYVDGKEF